jgi:hypothetical protein
METLEVLSDRIQVKRLEKALEHFQKGKLYSHEDVFGRPPLVRRRAGRQRFSGGRPQPKT